MSDFTLNWGIVSAGLISQDFCTAVQSLQSGNHKLSGVAARNLDDAIKFAQKFNMEYHYDSYDDLFNNFQINIVYIGSINTTHRELCLKAINAGKHVLCEKPMSLNPIEQEEILSLAKEKGVFFMEALWTRFFPIIEKIKQELANGEIGELNFFSGNFMVPIKDVARVQKLEMGGGAILDIGIYPIQLACLMFNHERPIKITATGHLTPTGVDECCTIVLLFPGQRIAQINISSNTTMFAPTHLVGTKGVLSIPEFSWCPIEYEVNGRKVREELPDCEKTNFHRSVGLRFQAEAVREALAKGLKEHPLVTHDNSRLIMHIMNEAKRQLGYGGQTIPKEESREEPLNNEQSVPKTTQASLKSNASTSKSPTRKPFNNSPLRNKK